MSVTGSTQARPATAGRRAAPPGRAASVASSSLEVWLRTQGVNVNRHAAALRPFRREEFGTGVAAPSEGHIQAANELIASLRPALFAMNRQVDRAIEGATREPSRDRLRSVVIRKERAHSWVRAIEQVWDFYFELFGQRQSRFGEWLVGCDRIGLDCYQKAFVNVGEAKSIPAPPPFSYMRTGISPATFRRGIPLQRLGRQLNPFPLVQLPYHRLVNPWTLGAILHELSHNLQNDLGLAEVLPRAIERRLASAGLPRQVAATWRRWNRETFADMAGLLLGGPAIVASLFDVIGKSPATVTTYLRGGPHPTPYLRAFLSTELLRRMGFAEEASRYERNWTRLYPSARGGTIPAPLLDTFADAMPLVVDTICFQPHKTLGDRALAQVFAFQPKDQLLIEEAGRRLAAGNDPGVVPERFLIGAARSALDHKLARPGTITRNFYTELARR
jgi:hypothetical protein